LEQLVGERTRQYREALGWSQDELGRRLGEYGFPMHQTTVAKLEAGTRPIRLDEVWALSLIFHSDGVEAMWQREMAPEELAAWQNTQRLRDEINRLDLLIAETNAELSRMKSERDELRVELRRDLHDKEDRAREASTQGRPFDDDETLRRAIDSLPRDLREAVILRFMKGMSVEEIAAELGVSPTVAKRNSTEGLRMLAKIGDVENAFAKKKPERSMGSTG
jgi:RNA polymerase sigma factor (sigma-70 family)